MDEWLKLDPLCTRLRIVLPAHLNHYISDYRKNWKHDPVTDRDIDAIEQILKTIKQANSEAVIEMDITEGGITQEVYSMRHDTEIKYGDEVYAFQVNKSTGTEDTINKAKNSGLPISVHKEYVL